MWAHETHVQPFLLFWCSFWDVYEGLDRLFGLLFFRVL